MGAIIIGGGAVGVGLFHYRLWALRRAVKELMAEDKAGKGTTQEKLDRQASLKVMAGGAA